MNIFNQYGIKEVADVVFYSITEIGDEKFYTPVLAFDTLKISSLNNSREIITQKGGKGNSTILSWSFIKDTKLKLEDALFSEASMNLYLNGQFSMKMGTHISLISKLNVANKYGQKHYSIKAYPSPQLTHEEKILLFQSAQKAKFIVRNNATYESKNAFKYLYDIDNNEYVAENRKLLIERYIKRQQIDFDNFEINYPKINLAMPKKIIEIILSDMDSLKKVNSFSHDIYKPRVIDRFEKCHVINKNGLIISAKEQKENLFKKYNNDESSSYVIYYDPKTMQPFFGLDSKLNFNEEVFVLKQGTIYYKWSRTVDLIEAPNTIIGMDLKINTELFPDEYMVVGESYVRNRQGKDERIQIILNRVAISPTTNIELKADGGPVTFSMDVTVLKPKDNKDMIIFRQYKVEEDANFGGTKIVPQNSKHSYTSIIEKYTKKVISNNEIY